MNLSLRKATLLCCSTLTLAATGPFQAHAQETGAASAEAKSDRSSGDIVVTARRRAENIQSVPVSVQAFSAETLTQLNVQSTKDLQRLTPGVVLAGSGSDFNSTLTIRGQGRDVIGPIAPSVQSYVNDIPLPNWGAIVPTYDVQNVQVLKGPQGTLFGRNTVGGAVLFDTRDPSYEFGGYGQAQIGNLNEKNFEGALNIPIVKDVLAVRLAGQSRDREGYIKGGFSYLPDGQNVDTDSFRASVLFEPTSNIKNVTVFDYSHANLVPVSTPMGYGIGTGPNGEFAQFHFIGEGVYGAVGGTNALFDCGTSFLCDPDLLIAQVKADKYRKYYNSVAPFTHAVVGGVSNTTTVDLGGVTVKNIFGYRTNRIHEASDTDGGPQSIIDAYDVKRSDDQFTDELQFSGELMDGSLEWLVGGFYLKSKPGGPNSIAFNLIQPNASDVAANPFLGLVSPFLRQLAEASANEESKAVFASVSQDLGSIVEGLKLNLSARYTKDNVESCSINLPGDTSTASRDYDSCTEIPGVAVTSASFKKFTWSAGLDYQATDDLFTYAVVRRGYRAGGINTPNLGGTLVPFQAFDPLTVTDTEVGVKLDWTLGGIQGRTNIAGYYSWFRNVQVQATGLPPNIDGDGNPLNDPSNTSLIINGGKAKTRGIEVDGFVGLPAGFQLNYGLALFKGDISLQTPAALPAGVLSSVSNKFDRAPKYSFTLGAHYESPFEVAGGTLVGDVNYYEVGSYKVGLAPLGDYHTVDAFIGINKLFGSDVDASIYVQNLTDETFFINPNGSGAMPGYITESLAPPRTYGLRLRYAFGGG